MKFVLSILLLISTCVVYAEEILPEGCKPLHVKSDSIVLPANKSIVVMIHNLSNTDIWLTHTQSASDVNLNSHFEKGRWSAIALDNKKIELNCIESKPGHEQQIACASVVAVCQWPTSKRPEKIKGTVWAAENMTLSALQAFVGRHGYVLQQSEEDA